MRWRIPDLCHGIDLGYLRTPSAIRTARAVEELRRALEQR